MCRRFLLEQKSFTKIIKMEDVSPISAVWPQDVLNNPQSNGRNIDPVLATLTSREFYVYSPNFLLSGNAAGHYEFICDVGETFNFWIANIVSASHNEATGVAQAIEPGIITLTDMESGTTFWQTALHSTRINPAFRSRRSTQSVPYCIRAGQTFLITIDTPVLTAAVPTRLYVSIEGWKDYSY